MQFDDLLTPVSDEHPCGEDLLAGDDPTFSDYYFGVEGRFPERFFNLTAGVQSDSEPTKFDRGTMQFDRSTIRLAAEYKVLRTLLARSRDLRLLVIAAKFEILAGDVFAFSDTLSLATELMAAFPDYIHPANPEDRRDALGELDAMQTVVIPLEETVLLSDRRAGEIRLRDYLVATGKATRRSADDPYDPGAVLDAFGRAENGKTTEQLHGLTERLDAALKRMAETFLNSGFPSLQLDRLADRVAALKTMISTSRSDLVTNPPLLADMAADAIAPEDSRASALEAAVLSFAPRPRQSAIRSHEEARDHLIAAEAYLRRFEPSAPALVLVVQARRLIGRPLVEALDILLGDEAERARIEFGTETGFALKMKQMRLLSDTEANDIPAGAQVLSEQEAYDPPARILTRDQVGHTMQIIEDFFRQREPASPIPILLFRARSTLGRDFQATLRDLFPHD